MTDFNTEIWKIGTDGKLVFQDQSFLNRGLLFGDGLFETMIFSQGSIGFLHLHQERLREGCKILGLETGDISRVEDLRTALTDRFGKEKKLRIRWMVFRDGLGKYTPQTGKAVEMIQVQPYTETIKIKPKAYISAAISVPAAPWSHCKTLNALTYVMANLERKDRGMDEVILLSPKGYISEAGSANIFWTKNDRYFTPSLSCNGIAGVGRRAILTQLQLEDKNVTEGEFLPEELLQADQVFTSNVTGISYLKSIGQAQFDVAEIDFLEIIFSAKHR